MIFMKRKRVRMTHLVYMKNEDSIHNYSQENDHCCNVDEESYSRNSNIFSSKKAWSVAAPLFHHDSYSRVPDLCPFSVGIPTKLPSEIQVVVVTITTTTVVVVECIDHTIVGPVKAVFWASPSCVNFPNESSKKGADSLGFCV